MILKKVDIGSIIPYYNNPRKNDDAVDAVMESIKQCSYISPIIVDEEMIVLAGHTRLKALKKLGYNEIEIGIIDGLTEEQKKKYRLLDNKTNEFADWDLEKLKEELDGLDFGDFDFDFCFDVQENEKSQEELEQEFRERMLSGELSEDSYEYQEFLQKFEQKKTTDDCYTPDNIYEVAKDWCVNRYCLGNRKIIRPFFPGGDYQKEKYPKNCVVIDNPPFSIISDICKWYEQEKIDYFLFGPTLTILGIMRGNAKYVVVGSGVVYENGAIVNTSFVTNLGDDFIVSASDLRKSMDEVNKNNLKSIKKQLPKFEYPDEVLTATMLTFMAAHGIEFSVKRNDAYFIRELDEQKQAGKAIYGSGYLLSEKAAAEKAAAEKAAAEKAAAEKAAAEKAAAEKVSVNVWKLSEREKDIVRKLG